MLGERGRGGTPCDGLASYLVGVAIHLNIFNMDTRKTEQKVEVSLERGGGRVLNNVFYWRAPPQDPFPRPFNTILTENVRLSYTLN